MEDHNNMNFVGRILKSSIKKLKPTFSRRRRQKEIPLRKWMVVSDVIDAAERLKEALTPRNTPPPEETPEPIQEELAEPLQGALEELVRQVQEVPAESVQDVQAELVQDAQAELVQDVQAESVQEVQAESVQEVQAGSVQAELAQAEAELAQAEAEFVQAQAELVKAEAELVKARAESVQQIQSEPTQEVQAVSAHREEELDYIPYDEDSDNYLLGEEEHVNTNWWLFASHENNNTDSEEDDLQPLIFTAALTDDEHHIQPESATTILASVIDYNSDLFSSPSTNSDQNYTAAREDTVLTDWPWFEEFRSIDSTTNTTNTTNSQQDSSSQTSIFASELFSPTRETNYMALTQIEFDEMFNATDEVLDETDDDDSSYENNNTFNIVHINTDNSIIPKEKNDLPSSSILGKRERDDDDDDYHNQKLTKYNQ